MPYSAAGQHPFETAGGQRACRSVCVFIADAALYNLGKGGDAGMGMEPETGERFCLSVEEVKEHEGFQKTAKVNLSGAAESLDIGNSRRGDRLPCRPPACAHKRRSNQRS